MVNTAAEHGAHPGAQNPDSIPPQAPGRARQSRAVLRWTRRILGGLLALLVVLALAGAIYQTVATEFDKRAYLPPGQLVDVGGHRLHLYCVGTATPTAILESGLATPAPHVGLGAAGRRHRHARVRI